MALTRILNNQVTDASGANAYLGINAAAKLQNYSITSGKIANNLTYGSNLTITGNLDVQGATTTIDTYNVVIEDPLLLLAKDQTGSPTFDIGFIGERGDETNIAFVWDESADEFITAFTSTTTSNTTITVSSYANFKTYDAAVTGNLAVTGTSEFTGNIEGQVDFTNDIAVANIVVNGTATITDLGVTGALNVDGNITGGNLISNAAIEGTTLTTTGTATVGNVSTAGTISATGNITGGNIISNALISGATLNTTGNATIGGNLIVQGNITYINIDDLRVEDPIIIMGTGPNGAPLTTDDNMDRGIYMEYYTTGLGNAFVGWQNSSGNMIIANDVTFSGNNVVSVGSYGTLNVGNVYAEKLTSAGNVDATNFNASQRVVATGNVDGANFVTTGDVTTATVTATGNITAANIDVAGIADLGNLTIDGDDITSDTGEVVINDAGADVNFRVEGDTNQNLLFVDAGTDTVIVGSATATTGATLKVAATDSMLIPTGNTLQRPSGVTGMLRFNTTTDQLEFYDADGWTSAGSVFTVVVSDQFIGDDSTTTFTLSEDSSTAATIVSINGIVQIPTTAYSVTGNSLQFTEAPAPSDVIDARILTTTTTVTALQNATGSAVLEADSGSSAFNITGNLIPTANVTYNLGSNTARFNELWLAGSTITLGTIVIKDAGSNQIGFFQADGTTPATIDSNNVDTTQIANGTSKMAVVSSNGNIIANVGGSTVATIYSGGMTLGSNSITVGSIINGGSNGVGNIGSATSVFNTVFAKATSAQYADLAENYEADADYEPGTVVAFGGDKEVTVSGAANDKRVAGVVSTNPSYLMNSGQEGQYVAAIALQGRVPCKVTGAVRKGDLMVSNGDGTAVANNDAGVGTVIGKALENFDGATGVIEVVVGRF